MEPWIKNIRNTVQFTWQSHILIRIMQLYCVNNYNQGISLLCKWNVAIHMYVSLSELNNTLVQTYFSTDLSAKT